MNARQTKLKFSLLFTFYQIFQYRNLSAMKTPQFLVRVLKLEQCLSTTVH